MDFNKDLSYAGKVVKSFLSGYSHLVEFDGKFWQPLKIYSDWEDVVVEQMHYVCLQFNNGRHLPVPIFDDLKNSNAGIFQIAAIRMMMVLSFWQARKAKEDSYWVYDGGGYPNNEHFCPPTLYSSVKFVSRKLSNFEILVGDYSFTPFDWSWGTIPTAKYRGPFTRFV